ncbi:hypothetical protein BDQ17DRAFT_1426078 [Cyathus striatus]|nr:hypothetical protein BDQ17DRAFT_1426078 [Cyathus striatus]
MKLLGPSQELVSRIHYLRELVKNLSEALPLEPAVTRYNFSVDSDEITEYGALGAFSKCMETCFETYKYQDGTISFTERGWRLENDLIRLMKSIIKDMSEQDRTVFREAWLERLIETARRYQKSKLGKRRGLGSDEHVQLSSCSKRSKRAPTQAADMAEPIIVVTTDSEGDTDTDESDLDSPLLSSSQHRQAHPPQNAMKQTTLSSVWKPLHEWPEEEREAQRQRQQERNAVAQMEAHRREERECKKKKQRKRTLACERQRKHYAKIAKEKDLQSNLDNNINQVLMSSQCNMADCTEPDDGDLARISHPGMEGWRKKRNGKNGGTKQEKPKRTNWFHPILWTLIDKAMRKAAWSSEKAVSILQCKNGKIFKHIHRGTIIKWKEQGKNAWLEKTLQNVKNQHSLSGSGRSGILAKYPNIVEEIKKTLKDLRLSGIPVNVVMGHSIMLTIINQHEPSLLTGEFRCSERFVRDFFQSVMNWSLRQATRAAAHLPIDAPDSCK